MRSWLLVGLFVSACSGGHGGTTTDATSVPMDGALIAPVDPMCPVLGAAGSVTFEPPAADGKLAIVVSDNTGVTLSRVDITTSDPVTLSVPACGMVTAVRTGIPDAITWTGVQPGDDLVDPRVATAPVVVEVTAQSATNALEYDMYIGCTNGSTLQDGEATATAFSGISPQCAASATSVAASFMASYQTTTEYATATATIANGKAALTFGAFAPAPMTTHVDLTGVAAFDQLSIQTHQVPAAGLDEPYALRGLETGSDSSSGDADAGSGAGTLVVMAESGLTGEDKSSVRIDAYDALPAAVSIDASTLLPLVTYTESVVGGRFALALSTPSPTNASVTLANLAIADHSSWMIVAPADTPVMYPPYLPSDLALALDAYTFVRDVVVYDIPGVTYADARVHLDRIPQATPTVTNALGDGTPTTAMRITRVDTNNTISD